MKSKNIRFSHTGQSILTEPNDWLKYWQENLKLPKQFNNKSPASRCIAKELFHHLKERALGNFLEIGCCPGKWMAFVHNKFGMKVSGIDYLDEGIDYTHKNLNLLDIPFENLWTGDILSFNPQKDSMWFSQRDY